MALIVMPCVGIIAFTGSVYLVPTLWACYSCLTTDDYSGIHRRHAVSNFHRIHHTTGTSYLLTCGTSVTRTSFYKW